MFENSFCCVPAVLPANFSLAPVPAPELTLPDIIASLAPGGAPVPAPMAVAPSVAGIEQAPDSTSPAQTAASAPAPTPSLAGNTSQGPAAAPLLGNDSLATPAPANDSSQEIDLVDGPSAEVNASQPSPTQSTSPGVAAPPPASGEHRPLLYHHAGSGC